jgi:hypothetical protein
MFTVRYAKSNPNINRKHKGETDINDDETTAKQSKIEDSALGSSTEQAEIQIKKVNYFPVFEMSSILKNQFQENTM